MAKVTQVELDEINNWTQILLRLLAVGRATVKAHPRNEPLAQQLEAMSFNAIGVDLFRRLDEDICRPSLGLFSFDCQCRANELRDARTTTLLFLPRERGFSATCAHCGLRHAWSCLRNHAITFSSSREMIIDFRVKSNWITEATGSWDEERVGVSKVKIQPQRGPSFGVDFMPIDVWEEWKRSTSPGGFFHSEIRWRPDRSWK